MDIAQRTKMLIMCCRDGVLALSTHLIIIWSIYTQHYNFSVIKVTHTVQSSLKCGCVKHCQYIRLPVPEVWNTAPLTACELGIDSQQGYVSSSTPLGRSCGPFHRGDLQDKTQNAVLHTVDI